MLTSQFEWQVWLNDPEMKYKHVIVDLNDWIKTQEIHHRIHKCHQMYKYKIKLLHHWMHKYKSVNDKKFDK